MRKGVKHVEIIWNSFIHILIANDVSVPFQFGLIDGIMSFQ